VIGKGIKLEVDHVLGLGPALGAGAGQEGIVAGVGIGTGVEQSQGVGAGEGILPMEGDREAIKNPLLTLELTEQLMLDNILQLKPTALTIEVLQLAQRIPLKIQTRNRKQIQATLMQHHQVYLKFRLMTWKTTFETIFQNRYLIYLSKIKTSTAAAATATLYFRGPLKYCHLLSHRLTVQLVHVRGVLLHFRHVLFHQI